MEDKDMDTDEVNVNERNDVTVPSCTGTSHSIPGFDKVFDHVRSFGSYQRLIYIVTNLLAFPISTQFTALALVFGAPAYHCITPNVTCPSMKCCDECTSYEFEKTFTSTVTEWNLVCNRAYLNATIVSCFFAGMAIGSLLTGIVSDAWGRKKCMFLSMTVMFVAGVISCFAESIAVIAFFRFIVGFSLVGYMVPQYIHSMELVGPKRRTAAGNIAYIFIGLHATIITGIAYLVRNWRMLLLIATLPAVLLLPLWWLIPESPRWLIAHNQTDEAYRILKKFGGKKNKQLDDGQLRTVIEAVRRDHVSSEQKVKKYTPIDLVRTPKLRKWILIMCYQWFVVALVSFGIFLFVTQLPGDVYANILFMNVAAALKVPIVWLIFLKFGRRVSHGTFITIAGIILLLVLAVYKDYPKATTALALLGFILANGNWTGAYLITSELFPTVLRNTAQGTCSLMARIGGILAHYMAMLGQLPGMGVALPSAIFGAFALIAGISMYWIPETLFSPMHQTIEEAEEAKEDFRIPCWGKPLERAKRAKDKENQDRNVNTSLV